MEEVWQFPYCWAAIDVWHSPLKCPSEGLEVCKECHNFKNFYSVVLLGVVQSSTHSLQYVAPGNQPSKQHVAQESSRLYSRALIHCSMLHLETSIPKSTLQRATSKLCSPALTHRSMLHLETNITNSTLHRAACQLRCGATISCTNTKTCCTGEPAYYSVEQPQTFHS